MPRTKTDDLDAYVYDASFCFEIYTIFFLHLQVQPGQSKTIAYKQVSYQYNKDLDGKPGEKIINTCIMLNFR